MLVIVLPLAFVLLCLIAVQKGLDGRQAVVASTLVVGTWLAVITELLSLFHFFTSTAVALSWIGLIIGAAFYCRRNKVPNFKIGNPHFSPLMWLLLFGVGMIAVGTFFTALLAPPNNWDSMTYHMSRVMHWIQNGSVAFYPTGIARQLYQPPFAEWIIAQVQLLVGSDYLANLIQWISWIGCLVTTSLIARELGAELFGQVFAVVVAATINMGILQSSSTQNDLVVSYWISCAVYLCLLGIRREFDWITVSGLGAAIGLSVLTKGTAYAYIAPFVLWVLVYAWRKQRRAILKFGFGLVLIGLILNVGQYSRNWRWFGSPTGGDTSLYANQAMSPALWVSVASRNIALHVAVPEVLDAKIGLSHLVDETIQAIHTALGLSVDDPRVTWPATKFQAVVLYYHEDSTAAPAQLALAIFAFGLGIIRIRSIRLGRSGIYGLAVLLTFVLFCLLLRWQPWNNRLHLPWFMLLAPFSAVLLERYLHRYLVFGVAAFLLVIAFFPTLMNQSRALVGSTSILRKSRWDIMFNNRPELENSYATAIDQVRELHCDRVGLQLGGDTWEYPLWARAEQLQTNFHFTYIKSAIDLPPEFDTCALIISKDSPKDFEANVALKKGNYILRWHDEHLAVYQAEA